MSVTTKRIAFIGAGNMAEALIKGMLVSKVISAKRIIAADVNAARLSWIHDEYGIKTESSNQRAAKWADIVVFAVKPQVLPEVLENIAPSLGPGKTVISIAAGVPTERIERALPKKTPVIRAMPNTPALVQRGVSAIAKGAFATRTHARLAREIFHSVGIVIQIEEKLMDAMTAVSGSGPAYAFLLMEAMMKAAVAHGLPREDALNIVAETVRGAGELVARTHQSPEKLRQRVTSPGGTTEAAIKVFQQKKLDATVAQAINAAVKRSRELAG